MRLLHFILLCAPVLVAATVKGQYEPMKGFGNQLAVKPFKISLSAPYEKVAGMAYHGINIDPKVKYDSFFCDLELKSIKKLGVMVKIHAGDYDRYMIRSDHK